MGDVARPGAGAAERPGAGRRRRAGDLERGLRRSTASIGAELAGLPPERRELVTGHESLGYFAARYGFRLVGALIPSLSSQAQASAANLADLTRAGARGAVPVIFNEIGTPAGVADAIADETGARVIEIGTHTLPDDGSYFTIMRDIARSIDDGLATRPGPRDRRPGPARALDNEFMLRALVAGCSWRWPAPSWARSWCCAGWPSSATPWRTGCSRASPGRCCSGLPGIGGAVVGAVAMIAGVSLVRAARACRGTPRSACSSWGCWRSAS